MTLLLLEKREKHLDQDLDQELDQELELMQPDVELEQHHKALHLQEIERELPYLILRHLQIDLELEQGGIGMQLGLLKLHLLL